MGVKMQGGRDQVDESIVNWIIYIYLFVFVSMSSIFIRGRRNLSSDAQLMQ